MTAPPDYWPGRTRRLAADPTNLPVSAASGDTLYGVGQPYGQPSKPLGQRELRETFGGVGTLFFAGLIESDEYVPELTGDRAIQTYDRMWRSDGQIAAVINVWVLPLI